MKSQNRVRPNGSAKAVAQQGRTQSAGERVRASLCGLRDGRRRAFSRVEIFELAKLEAAFSSILASSGSTCLVLIDTSGSGVRDSVRMALLISASAGDDAAKATVRTQRLVSVAWTALKRGVRGVRVRAVQSADVYISDVHSPARRRCVEVDFDLGTEIAHRGIHQPLREGA